MKSIKEKSEEYTSDITNPVTNNAAFLAYKTGANYVLEEIENLVKTTIGEGETYHYNLYFGLVNLLEQLKK